MKQTLSPIIVLLSFAALPNGFCFASDLRSHSPNQRLVSLTVESTGWSAELFWTSIFDKDLVAFAVQRSSNGTDYQDIITYNDHYVTAGDTDIFREQDNDPMPGNNFYRIRFTLSDGEQVYSERRKVYFKEVAAFEIFPNPTGRVVNLLLKKFRGEEVEIFIFDSIGDQVFHRAIPSVDDGMLRIELESMNPGIYAVSVMHKGKTFTRRLVVTSQNVDG